MSDEKKIRLAHDYFQVLGQLKRMGWRSKARQKVRPSEFRLLVTLLHSKAISMKVSDLGSEMQITPAAVTHMINPLEKGGHIERLTDPTDRRVVLVKLTEKGRKKIEDLKANFIEVLAGLIEYLGDQDAQEFLRLLTKSVNYLKDPSKGK